MILIGRIVQVHAFTRIVIDDEIFRAVIFPNLGFIFTFALLQRNDRVFDSETKAELSSKPHHL